MKYSGGGNNNQHKYQQQNASTLFCEQVSTVTSLFEKWTECERTVVMYALLKRLRYPTIKFLQCSIENNIINNPQINILTRQQYLKNDLNANDINYLQKLLNAYKIDDINIINSNNDKNFNNNCKNLLTPMTINDKDSILLYDSDSSTSTSNSTLSITNSKQKIISSLPSSGNRNDKIYNYKKQEILKDILTMLPLLKPGNEEAKNIYLSIIPIAVEDTVRQIVATELVQQVFSYLLIHPAISNDDRKSLGSWLKHLEEHIHSLFSGEKSFYILTNNNSKTDTSISKSSSISMTSSLSSGVIGNGNAGIINNNSISINNNNNNNTWLAIAPPSSQLSQTNVQQQNRYYQQQQHQTGNSIYCGSSTSSSNGETCSTAGSGSSTLSGGSACGGSSIYSGTSNEWNMSLSQITDNICDDFNRGVKLSSITTKNLTSSSQNNSLGLIYDGNQVCMSVNSVNSSSSNGSTGVSSNLNISSNDDHHVSFSKNGTEIIDFDVSQTCDKCNTQIVGYNSVMICCDHQQQQSARLITAPTKQSSKNYSPLSAAAAIIATPHQSELPRWNLDGKIISSLKTRRSNSLTTPAPISSGSSSSSSTSSVITVNDNCSSNSSENLSQYTLKPRSYSLSIENPRGGLSSSGSDTRLDDLKQPNYLKFQTHNVGMSNIGQWLKSLRLHKYIGLFTTMTYEDMLEITENYLQSLGVTKGASHKLALCINKLKDRYINLVKLEQDLLSGSMNLSAIIEELTNIVLTPMKPIDSCLQNVALKFLEVLELVSSTVFKKEVNTIQDEDCVNALLWILERAIHAEAFMTHTNQLKEQKFKLSKLKAQFSPKIHSQHNKNGSNGSLNKPRWTKSRSNKNDNTKSSSIDRINHRKNSHEIVNFSINQQNISNTSVFGGNGVSTIHNLSNNNLQDIEKYHHHQHHQINPTSSNALMGGSTNVSSISSISSAQQSHFNLNCNSNNKNGSLSSISSNSCPQYKSSSYPNFSNSGVNNNLLNQNQSQEQKHQQNQNQQQVQQLQHQQHHQLQEQHQHNQQYRHRHSLNNLIVVSSNPQQPQQMIFKQGKGGFSKIDTATVCGDNIIGKNRRSSITKTNLDNYNNVGNNLLLNKSEKTFAEIIAVSNNNNNSNKNINSINHIKSSLLNCGSMNVIGGGDDSINDNCDDNNGVNDNCCNSNLTIQLSNTTTNRNLLNRDINDHKLSKNNLNDINRSLEQLEFLCLQMTEQAIN